MKKITLRLLILEDEVNDAKLEIAELENAGYICKWKRVETREDFLNCLASPEYDLILTDYRLPAFDGLTAISLVMNSNIDIPVIMVSGTLGEEAAIESLKAGAIDYVLKNRLSRLSPVVKRALKEQAEHLQRKEIEKTLYENEEKYRSLVETAKDAIITINSSGDIISWNRGACEIFGFTIDEILNKPLTCCLPDRYRYYDIKKILQKLETGLIHLQRKTIELLVLNKKREEFPVELSFSSWETDSGIFYTGIIRDMSEKKILEKQLIQSQKMEAIGTLAGGIAHDFNNILSGLMGFSELSIVYRENPEKLIYYLNELNQGLLRAADLVKQILTFSRKSEEKKVPVQTCIIINEALKLIKSTIPASILIKQDIDSKEFILADSTQIHQVIMNLCTNAYHAFPGLNGEIAISLQDVQLIEDNSMNEIAIPLGDYQLLIISDNGIGMDKKTREKIFEPYFTTNKIGEGTGLGMAVVHGIIKSHKSHILVESQPGVGSTFKIYFPILKNNMLKESIEKKFHKNTIGRGNILVVDDEPSITETIDDYISDFGYSITTFNDPELAHRDFISNPEEYDLLVTDMSMPKMTGIELIKRLKLIKPELFTIITSGFSEKLDREKAIELGIDLYLDKPVPMDNLLLHINKILIDKE